MINREDLIKIGQFRKPHGTKGEISIVMADSIRNPLEEELACPFLICEIDGIFVPFRIEDCRFISDSTAYIQLKNINSDQQARMLTHKEVFYPKKYIKEDSGNDSFTWDYFIGFTITDEKLGKIGKIIDVDTTTINTLFIIEKENKEILVPAVEKLFVKSDVDKKELVVRMPEDLYSLNF